MLVEARVVDSRQPAIEPREVEEIHGETMPARELVERLVRAEVAAFNDPDAARALVFVRSPAEIEAGAAAGRIELEAAPDRVGRRQRELLQQLGIDASSRNWGTPTPP